ncbi:MAG: energy transducer TonB [Bdellovibrio sp.]|nr:energy transducer TonB [Methylotenera sp.]
MLRALEFIDRDSTRFAFFLCLSILGHIVVLIYAIPATFPNLKDEPPTAAKLKALTFQITQVYSDYHEPIIATKNANLTKADIAEVMPVATDATEAKIAEPSTTEVETDKPEIAEADTKSEYKDYSISGSKLQSILNEKYYSLGELDQLPETQTDIDIESLNLLKFAQGGKLELRLWVNEQGQVVNVEVIKSEMPSAFVESAIKLFLQAQFSAGRVNNNPVKFVSKVVIRYEPH